MHKNGHLIRKTQRLIILRGCMGSGKTTLAQKYKSFELKTAVINIDHFKKLFDYFEKDSRPIVHGAANAALRYLLEQGFSVVMEGVFQNPIFIEQAVEIAKKHEVAYKVFELKTSLETLKKRDKLREEVKKGIRESLEDGAIESIFNKLIKNPYPQAINIDTEKLTIEQAVKFIDSKFSK